jgi:hypothetical protein
MTRKFGFCIATNKVGSEQKEIVELDLDDDLTQEEINDQVGEIYNEWLIENNNGWFNEIK